MERLEEAIPKEFTLGRVQVQARTVVANPGSIGAPPVPSEGPLLRPRGVLPEDADLVVGPKRDAE